MTLPLTGYPASSENQVAPITILPPVFCGPTSTGLPVPSDPPGGAEIEAAPEKTLFAKSVHTEHDDAPGDFTPARMFGSAYG